MGDVIPLRSESTTPDIAKIYRWACLLGQRGVTPQQSHALILDMIKHEVSHVIHTEVSPDFIFFAVQEEDGGPAFAYSFPNPVKEA
jgi:hypothetical protein